MIWQQQPSRAASAGMYAFLLLIIIQTVIPLVASFQLAIMPVWIMPITNRRSKCLQCHTFPPRDHCVTRTPLLYSRELHLGKVSRASTRLDYQRKSEASEIPSTQQQIYRGYESKHDQKGDEEHIRESTESPSIQERRRLGGLETFMLPRTIGPDTTNDSSSRKNYQRPPMNHISAFVLTSTPSTWALQHALDNAIRTHPLLRARVTGNGHPRKWLDPIRRMVRWNGWDNDEKDPLEFVVYSADDCGFGNHKSKCMSLPPSYWGGSLSIVVCPGTTRQELDTSWKSRFEQDLDDDTIVSVVNNGTDQDKYNDQDMWKLELHRLCNQSSSRGDIYHDNSPGTPCALVLTMNHCISDQGSVNLIMDQILSDIDELEDGESSVSSTITSPDTGDGGSNGSIVKHPSIEQPIPPCVEDSVLGSEAAISSGQNTMRLNIVDILKSPFSSSMKYVISYALRQIKGNIKLPTLYPAHETGMFDLLDPTCVLVFGSTLGQAKDIADRRSNVEYRTLSAETTSALVRKSKMRRVPISMTLAAAVAVTCTDFFGDTATNEVSSRKHRFYKILQSLDTRRISGSDHGDTLSCQAGGMDLILGPLPDHVGRVIRHHSKLAPTNDDEHDGQSTNEETNQAIEKFWTVARQSYNQTLSFLKGRDAVESVRLFDLGMTVSDIGRLVEVYAKSRVSKGRAWSAGITNAGEYEHQKSIPRQGILERGHLMAFHGMYGLDEIYYATSHVQAGITFPVNCISVGGKMSITMNPPWPLISKRTSEEFATAFIELLNVIAEADA